MILPLITWTIVLIAWQGEKSSELQALVVQKEDNAIHRINLYPVDSAIIGFPNTYPLDSDLSSG